VVGTSGAVSAALRRARARSGAACRLDMRQQYRQIEESICTCWPSRSLMAGARRIGHVNDVDLRRQLE